MKKNHSGTVSLEELRRSRVACYRVEDAIWSQLRGSGISERSPLEALRAALARTTPPEWCASDAWERMCKTFGNWAQTFGNLRTFVELRNAKDESGGEDE